jgi:Circularly permutated YpsA SLOG family
MRHRQAEANRGRVPVHSGPEFKTFMSVLMAETDLGGYDPMSLDAVREIRVEAARHIADFIRESRVSRLMVAGSRETRDPGIGERVERFLIVVFRSLVTAPRPTV